MEDNKYPVLLIRPNSSRTLSCSSLNRKSKNRRGCGRVYGRVVDKLGKSAVHPTRTLLCIHYVHDLVNTLINAPWKWTLLALSTGFFLSWLIFAYLWMWISMDDDNAVKPCLDGVQAFSGYLLFSIETQTTIGYGNRHINSHCPEAVVLLCLQLLVGACICGILVGIVFEKISGPGPTNPKRAFSKHAIVSIGQVYFYFFYTKCFDGHPAVLFCTEKQIAYVFSLFCDKICLRDGKYCLIFRVRDFEKKYQCSTQIKVYLVQYKGEEIYLKSLKLEPVGFLLWPIEVVHVITERSPFWDLSAYDLVMRSFEIIVALEGTSLSTANTSSTTTSYLSKEILWGHTFNPCVRYEKDRQSYVVDHKLFNGTKEVLMPLCSAQRLAQVFHEYDLSSNSSSSLFDCNKFKENYEVFRDFSPSIILHAMDESSSSSSSSSSDDDKALFSSLNKFVVGENHKTKTQSFTETAL